MKAAIYGKYDDKPGNMQLYSKRIKTPDGEVALTSDVVVRVDGADYIEKRVTATRVVLMGPLALAVKKPKGSVFVTVENDSGFFSMLEVHAKKRSRALKFAALANAAAKRAQ